MERCDSRLSLIRIETPRNQFRIHPFSKPTSLTNSYCPTPFKFEYPQKTLDSGDVVRKLMKRSRNAKRYGSMEDYDGNIGLDARLDYYKCHKNYKYLIWRNRFENL